MMIPKRKKLHALLEDINILETSIALHIKNTVICFIINSNSFLLMLKETLDRHHRFNILWKM